MATDIESAGISDHSAYAINHGGADKRKTCDDRERKIGGIRVYKKSSLNSKITVYLGRRDFVDHITHVDPIDGVVLIDREYIQSRKVFGHVLATFRYGREDLDVLGLTFRKELYLVNEQIFPAPEPKQNILDHATGQSTATVTPNGDFNKPPAANNSISNNNNTSIDNEATPVNTPASIWSTAMPKTSPGSRPLTRLQERLLKKLGPNAFPFFFELPPLCPASVTLQPGPGDTGKPCGVDYELKAYVADSIDEKPHKKDSVRLAIRKIMYAPSRQGEQPSVEVSKDFVMSPNKLNLEASLDKELYHHGESIAVNVHIANNSNRTVKKIKVSVRQFADICLFSAAQYKCTVADLESEEGFPIGPGFTLSKVYYLRPLLANNKDKRGLALDGQLKHEDTNLASSTLVTDPAQRENLGIVVQYRVRVKLCLGALAGELTAELPFTLMHPKPIELYDSAETLVNAGKNCNHDANTLMNIDRDELNQDGTLKERNNEGDLIQLDDDTDDIIFEDFARLRLEQAGDFQPSMDNE